MLRAFASCLMFVILIAPPSHAQSTSDVKLVQQKLAKYDAGPVDGVLGAKTTRAIKAYERDWAIPVTGEVTTELIAMLKREHPLTRSQWYELVNKDCEVWNDHPMPRETATWSGRCVDGRAEGKGVLVWSFVENGQLKRESYKGAYLDGKHHGKGIYTWADGDRYEGEWKGDIHHGEGVYKWANGDVYKGSWKDDKHHGYGVYIWADGERYEGTWKNGEPAPGS